MEKKPKTIGEKMLAIQQALNAPKDKYNKFGGYAYRSCEGILEAVKPLLKEYGVVLTITDEIVNVGNHNYIKATAKVTDAEQGYSWETSALAREPEAKKGMDDSQITGAASSYARKYALNGLFSIDDAKDADATNTHGKVSQESEGAYTCAQSYTTRMNELAINLANCNTRDDLEMLWSSLSEMEMKNQQIRDMFTNRKAAFNK